MEKQKVLQNSKILNNEEKQKSQSSPQTAPIANPFSLIEDLLQDWDKEGVNNMVVPSSIGPEHAELYKANMYSLQFAQQFRNAK